MSEQPDGNQLAPEGMVWCCRDCGKRSRDLYGLHAIDRGYDASCMLNAELVDEAYSAAPENGKAHVNWNQAICDVCWARRCPGRVPVRVSRRDVETCAYCGHDTDSGIYVREHPQRVPYPRPERTP